MLSLRSRALRTTGCAGALALATQVVAGCYTYAPVDTSLSVPAQREVAVEINDRGRFELNGSIGTSPKRVEGRLVRASDSTLTVAVQHVISVGGERNDWAGEQVDLRRTGVSEVQERRFSRSRTILGVALTLGAVLAVFLGTGLVGGGGGDGNGGTEQPPPGES